MKLKGMLKGLGYLLDLVTPSNRDVNHYIIQEPKGGSLPHFTTKLTFTAESIADKHQHKECNHVGNTNAAVSPLSQCFYIISCHLQYPPPPQHTVSVYVYRVHIVNIAVFLFTRDQSHFHTLSQSYDFLSALSFKVLYGRLVFFNIYSIQTLKL